MFRYKIFSPAVVVGTLLMNMGSATANEEVHRPPVIAGQQADQYYDPQEMAEKRREIKKAMGGQKTYLLQFDRLELQSHNGEDNLVLDGQAWYGGDINKFWVKTEAELNLDSGDVEEAEVQALWSRAVSPFWDVQAGLRHDFKPGGLDHLVLGVQGLAPYWFEVDAAAFLSTDGDLTASAELEYDFLLTQRLILQPRAEIGFSFQDIAKQETGAGFTSLSAGVRLRYEIKREFAPYVGIEWQRKLGGTADLARAAGEDVGRTVLVAGIRAWF